MKKRKEQRYEIMDRAKFVFYQIPKILIHGEKYKDNLTNNDILAYSILMDRLNVSIKNNWYDEEGYIYFVYSNNELQKILNVSKNTVVKIKKNLTKLGLLEEERTGRANRLYLLEPEIENVDEAKYIMKLDEDIEDASKFTKDHKEKITKNLKQNHKSNSEEGQKLTFFDKTLSDQDFTNSHQPKKVKNCPSEGQKLTPSNKNLIKSKDFKDIKEISKTDKTDFDIISDSFQSKEKNPEIEQQIIDDFIEDEGLYLLYGKKLINRMKMFSFNDFDTFTTFINKLEFAQKSIEKETEITLPIYEGSKYFEFIEQELLRTFNRAIQQHRFGKVNNIASYLFISFKNVFDDLATTIKEETSNTSV